MIGGSNGCSIIWLHCWSVSFFELRIFYSAITFVCKQSLGLSSSFFLFVFFPLPAPLSFWLNCWFFLSLLFYHPLFLPSPTVLCILSVLFLSLIPILTFILSLSFSFELILSLSCSFFLIIWAWVHDLTCCLIPLPHTLSGCSFFSTALFLHLLPPYLSSSNSFFPFLKPIQLDFWHLALPQLFTSFTDSPSLSAPFLCNFFHSLPLHTHLIHTLIPHVLHFTLVSLLLLLFSPFLVLFLASTRFLFTYCFLFSSGVYLGSTMRQILC